MLVCPDCFGNAGLQRRIVEVRPDFPDQRCDFHPSKKGVPIEAVARIVDPVFRENYSRGAFDPYFEEHRGDDLSQVLWDLTTADDDRILVALADALEAADVYWPSRGEGPFYDPGFAYVRDRASVGSHGRLWAEFCEGLMHRQRFFDGAARDRLGEIFDGVHHQRDEDRNGPVYMITPDEPEGTFHRARVAELEAERTAIRADLAGQLGPPPRERRTAGRLNPAGVAAFYGAYDMATCVAELRPSVGGMVVGARFRIVRPICVLDTTRFGANPRPPNIYAANALERAAQWRFMRTFMAEITQPVLPGQEHLAYLPTQAVAEYLNHHHRFSFAGQERTIDAIIYGSAQHPGGRNIALLGAAATVGASAVEAPLVMPIPGASSIYWEAPQTPPVRIVPIEGSFEVHRVRGAVFSTAPWPNPSDPDAEGD